MYGNSKGGSQNCGETIAKKDVQLPSTPVAPLTTNTFTKQPAQSKTK